MKTEGTNLLLLLYFLGRYFATVAWRPNDKWGLFANMDSL